MSPVATLHDFLEDLYSGPEPSKEACAKGQGKISERRVPWGFTTTDGVEHLRERIANGDPFWQLPSTSQTIKDYHRRYPLLTGSVPDTAPTSAFQSPVGTPRSPPTSRSVSQADLELWEERMRATGVLPQRQFLDLISLALASFEG